MLLKRRAFVGKGVAGGLAVAMAGGLLAGCGEKKSAVEFHAVDITGASYAKGFALTDLNGQERSLSDFKGDVVAVFFGYTHCPDVCPTTMSEMAQVRQKLGKEGDKFQVVFVSLDPKRDTPEILKSYLAAFDPSFIGLRTESPDALPKLAKDFKIFYQYVDQPSAENYTVDHTAATYIYDPKGQVRLFARYQLPVDELTSDVRALMRGA